MKKIMTMVIALFVSVLMVSAAAEQITVKVNNKVISFPDAQPYIDENSRTLIPVRFVSEALGAKVDWQESTKTVIIKKDKYIMLKIGEAKATVNGTVKTFDTKAIIKQDRTFVPLRFVSETLGAKVDWQESTKTILITTSTATYDPSKWVEVDNNGEDSELALNIAWDDYNYFLENCNYAESVIAKKYNADIAKRVVDIARKKTDRSIKFAETVEYNKKKIDVEVYGSSVSIMFWKAGVD